jgi:excinuclease UvrABC ATPase subunit
LYSALARKFRGEVERGRKYGDIKGASTCRDVIMLDQNPIGKKLEI